jgi:4-hydroxythreonine-4-phosphate dehydrogenase
MTQTNKPILAVTLGDPAGIGPEIVSAALADPMSTQRANGIIVGDLVAVERAIKVQNLNVKTKKISAVSEAEFIPGVLNVFDINISSANLTMGKVSVEGGRAAIEAIEVATRLALDGQVKGVVTAPINKEAIWAAGSEHLGHTEMLGALTNAPFSDTMFVVKGLKLFFSTRHMALRKALDQISIELIEQAIRRASQALDVFGEDQTRLAVAAINPHGGENGNFGREEIDVLRPAIETTLKEGINVTGPIPADSVFHQGLNGRYDGILTHFHDQGHIPSKTYDFDGTVSVTLGLPILRTSVDHGTAFDIAGKGLASAQTMIAAFKVGADYSVFTDRIRAAYPTN